MARVAVIGGGVAGLSVAFLRARAGDIVTLFEANSVAGGQLLTERVDGFVVEQGAEGFVAGSEAMSALAVELGLENSLVGQLVTQSLSFDGRELRALGPGEAAQFLGFQVPRRDLGRGIRAFSGGMGELSDALIHALRSSAQVRLGASVERIARSDGGWLVEARGEKVPAERVVVATSATAAARLLGPEFGAVARDLELSSTSSSVTVSLAFRQGALAHDLAATGLVVAEAAQVDGFRACTFTSSKLPGRAPDGYALVRAFFRPSGDEIRTLSDDEWVARAERGIARAIPTSERAARSWVARWPDALPMFDPAHETRVRALETALSGSGLAVSGAAFHGSGIDAALRSARRVAAEAV